MVSLTASVHIDSLRAKGQRISTASKYERSSQRAYDREHAKWWRRLGLGPKLKPFDWTVEDDVSAMLADQIRKEIDDEIMKAILGTK